MKKTRWRAIMKAEGYKKIEEYWNGYSHIFWVRQLEHGEVLLFKEEILKNKNILSWLVYKECPHCEYCNGCGTEDTDGWYHGCCGCEGTGVDTSNIKKIGKLVY